MRKTAIDLTPSEFLVQKHRNPHSKELRCSTLFKFSCIEPKQRLSRTRLCKWLLSLIHIYMGTEAALKFLIKLIDDGKERIRRDGFSHRADLVDTFLRAEMCIRDRLHTVPTYGIRNTNRPQYNFLSIS